MRQHAPILYTFRRCPYAMRARMALLIGAVPCELREVLLRRKPAELAAVSAKATVPVLVLPNGSVIDESLDIMRWALACNDPEEWLAGDDAILIALFGGAFKQHLDRYKYPQRHTADRDVHRAAGLALLRMLEERLAEYSNLCRETRSLADIAIMPFVRQFAAVDAAWFAIQELERLRGWLDRHIAAPLFERAMTRFHPWRHGDPPVRLSLLSNAA